MAHPRVLTLRDCHEQDLEVYNKAAVNTAKKYFNIPDIDDYYKKVAPKPLVFCHFARGLADKVYNEVLDYPSMYRTVKEVCASLLPSLHPPLDILERPPDHNFILIMSTMRNPFI